MENISSPESVIITNESTDEADDMSCSTINDNLSDQDLQKHNSINEQTDVIPEKENTPEKPSENQETVESNTENISNIEEVEKSSESDDISLEAEQQDCGKSDTFLDFRMAPKINCCEKIVFSIDLSADMIVPSFKVGSSAFCPLVVIKRAIEMFVYTKSRIDSKHEYAVMNFHETAKWYQDFTNDPQEIVQALHQMNDIKPCIECPFTSILSLLDEVAVDLPSFSASDIVPPFILRIILIYGRSNCIPKVKENLHILTKLTSSPYFFLDILYVHESSSSDNKCQEIYDSFCSLDPKFLSYIYEVERDVSKLHNCMAKLLAHPLLRPLQKNACYKLKTM